MFLRIEISPKAEYSDPLANECLTQIARVHSGIAQKIRWLRVVDVYWIELDAPRDRVVQAVSQVFKDPVLNWVFSGDLLPSAAGETGTLLDLMQTSPHRPGVFHGIERRRRSNISDEKAKVALEALQMVLGRQSAGDQVISGELFLLEGQALAVSDLEWLARNYLTDPQHESWTLMSEMELTKNLNFQSEQVAKYLSSVSSSIVNRWMQYRGSQKVSFSALHWDALKEALVSSAEIAVQSSMRTYSMEDEECYLYSSIDFSKPHLDRLTESRTKFVLLSSQLEAIARGMKPKLQVVQGLLPQHNRLWLGSEQGYHPERIWEEFNRAILKTSLMTSASVVCPNLLLETQEQNPLYFWTSTFSLSEKVELPETPPASTEPIDWIWVGEEKSESFSEFINIQRMSEVNEVMKKTSALCFVANTSGKRLGEVLVELFPWTRIGLDIVVDGHEAWLKSWIQEEIPLGLLFGIRSSNRAYFLSQLKSRNLNYVHMGTSAPTGGVRFYAQGQVALEWSVPIRPTKAMETDLLDEILYIQDPLQRTQQKSMYGIEELFLKNDFWAIRPMTQSGSGYVILDEIYDSSLTFHDFEWMLRKMTALGGQVSSLQVATLNGLKVWAKMLKSLIQDFGIQLNHFQNTVDPALQVHWCVVQVIAKIMDIRNVRSQNIRAINERLYFLSGQFDQPAFRWLAGLEGRHQGSLQSASAMSNANGLADHIIKMLTHKKLGAEIKIPSKLCTSGFVVSVNEVDRFSVEEEWKMMGIEFESLGRSTQSPYLIVREDSGQVHTLSVEDAAALEIAQGGVR